MEPWIAILIGAGGTWLVAILAIWGEKFLSWLFKPNLRIGRGEFSGTIGHHPEGKRARYYFVPVTNPSRFPPAHEVQLVLTRIEKLFQHGSGTLFDEIMPLNWIRAELNPVLTRTIGPDQKAGVFFIQDDGVLGITPALTAGGGLASHFPRLHNGPVTLWITLQAVSIEAESRSMRLKIEWNGDWYNTLAGLSNACVVTVDPEGKPMNDQNDDRPQYFEELRFAKKQQWAVATAAVTLLAAMFALQRYAAPDGISPKEKVVFGVVVTLIATFGCIFLIMLQRYIRATRLRLDASDSEALIRGISIAGVLIAVIILSAAGVLYAVAFR